MTRVTAAPARRGGGARAHRRRETPAFRAAIAVGMPNRRLHLIAREQARRGRRAEHIAAAGGVERVDGRRGDEGGAESGGGRAVRRSGGRTRQAIGAPPAERTDRLTARPPDRPAIEPRRRHVRRPLRRQRHDQQRGARADRFGGETQRVGGEQAHLVLVQLDHVEAAQPAGGVLERAGDPDPVVLHAEKQTVEVHVDRAAEALPQRLRGAERELEPGDEVEVERIQVAHHRPQLAPGPPGHSAGHPLGPPLGGVVVENDAVVGGGHLHAAAARRDVPQPAEELARLARRGPGPP